MIDCVRSWLLPLWPVWAGEETTNSKTKPIDTCIKAEH